MSSRVEERGIAANWGKLIPGVSLLAAALVAVPLLDVVVQSWPPRVGEAAWRFGLVGLGLEVLLTPLVGLALAMGLALVADRRRLLRVLAVLAIAIAVLLVVGLLGFVLDFLQLRGGLAEARRGAYDRAAVKALAVGTVFLVVTIALGLGGWRASSPPRLRESESQSNLVVGNPPPSKERPA